MVIGIYCRLSIDKDENQTLSSLLHQRKNGIEFCKKNGYEYIIYSEVVSGGVMMEDRKDGSKLIDDLLSDKLDGVWVDKEDRLYRNFNESTIFKYEYLIKKEKKYFVSDSEVDFNDDSNQIVNTILSLLSDFEKRNINRRTKRGVLSKLKKGGSIGILGYGFKKDKKGKVVIDEKVKKGIIKCFKVFVEKDFETIKEWMLYCQSVLGVKKSQQWFYYLYRSKRYNGVKEMNYDGKLYSIKLPKIVKDELYVKFVNKFDKMKTEKFGSRKNSDFENLLNGLIFCKKCGRKLNIASPIYKGKPNRLFRCVHKKNKDLAVNDIGEIEEHKTSMKYEVVIDIVYSMLCDILFKSNLVRDEYKRQYGEGINIEDKREELQILNNKLKNIKKGEFRVEEEFLNDDMTKDNLIKHKENYRLKRISLEGKIDSVKDDIEKHKSTNKVVKWIDRFKKEYSYDSMMKKNDSQKRDIMKKYIEKVELVGDRKQFELYLTLNIPIIEDRLEYSDIDYNEGEKNVGEKGKLKKPSKILEGKYETTLKQWVKDEKILCRNNVNVTFSYPNKERNLHFHLIYKSGNYTYKNPPTYLLKHITEVNLSVNTI